MQGTLQLGPVSWKTGLFRKSAWITKKQRRRIDPKKQQQSSVTAAEGIRGKSREYLELEKQAEESTRNRGWKANVVYSKQKSRKHRKKT